MEIKKITIIVTLILTIWSTSAHAQPTAIDGLLFEAVDDRSATFCGLENWDAYLLENDSTIIIPESIEFDGKALIVSGIASGAIDCSSSLTHTINKLVIPASMENVAGRSFACTRIIELVCCAGFPFKATNETFDIPSPMDMFPFPNNIQVKRIVVPTGSIERYKNAPGWRNLLGIESRRPELIEDESITHTSSSSKYFESKGWVAKITDTEGKEVQACYYVDSTEETELAIPATLTNNGEEYSVTSLGDEIFTSTTFKAIYIPQTVRTIKHAALSGSNISKITGMENVESLASGALASSYLRELTIPSEVKYLGRLSFSFGVKKGEFDKFEISENVDSIDGMAFYNVKLNTFISHRTVPPTATRQSFYGDGENSLGTLLVPAESIKAYRNAPGWNLFREIKAIDGSAIEEISTDNASETPEYYNLQGVKIANPTPGTFCIERRGTKARKIKL